MAIVRRSGHFNESTSRFIRFFADPRSRERNSGRSLVDHSNSDNGHLYRQEKEWWRGQVPAQRPVPRYYASRFKKKKQISVEKKAFWSHGGISERSECRLSTEKVWKIRRSASPEDHSHFFGAHSLSFSFFLVHFTFQRNGCSRPCSTDRPCFPNERPLWRELTSVDGGEGGGGHKIRLIIVIKKKKIVVARGFCERF